MTYTEENRNWNRPKEGRRPAEQLNEPGSNESRERSDFQDHLDKRADAGRGRGQQVGSSIIDRDKFESQLEGITDEEQRRVMSTTEDLVRHSEQFEEQALLNAMREETSAQPQRSDEEKTSPDVSLAHPHGPEGESHGGRGRDPLRFVEDSTPAGTNAYSQTRGPPAKKGEREE